MNAGNNKSMVDVEVTVIHPKFNAQRTFNRLVYIELLIKERMKLKTHGVIELNPLLF